jgi:redox-sensitive bicupin YhaK (pirin superfamily)
MTSRNLIRIIESVPTSDGAGVKLRRSLGSQRGLYVDPFLMLDEFYSDDPDDYLAGFPAHPHRGFETVTYMLDGHMRHEDHLGNRGDLGPGDVQWMTAARGIIHSEMPQQTEGRMRGFSVVAEPAVEGKNETRAISGHSVARDSGDRAPVRRDGEGDCGCVPMGRKNRRGSGESRRRENQHGCLVSRRASAGWCAIPRARRPRP